MNKKVKEDKPCFIKRLTAVFFLTVLAAFMISILLRFFSRQILIEKYHVDNGLIRGLWWDIPDALIWDTVKHADMEMVDWALVYPFPDTEPVKKTSKPVAFGKLNKIEDSIKSYTEEMLIGRKGIVECANELEELIGWDLQALSEYNGVTILNDGYLSGIVDKKDMTEAIHNINNLKNFLDSKDIPLFYVQCPFKICKKDIDLTGRIDFSNENADEFLRGLDNCNIPYLDFREYIHKEGDNHHEYFYRTDLHWRIETGFWAAKILIDYMNRYYGLGIAASIYEPDKYNYETYPEWFLGSEGRKVTTAKVKPDDFTLVTPKFKTDLRFRIPSYGLDETGDFGIMLNKDEIEEKDLYSKDPYSGYMYTGADLIETESLSDAASGNILIVRDSFAGCVVPFLALGARKTCSVDLRHFKGSLEGLIEDKKPDLVIVMYYPKCLSEEIQYDDHTATMDFR